MKAGHVLAVVVDACALARRLPVQLGVKAGHVLADGAWLVVVQIVPCLGSTKNVDNKY